MLNTSALSYWRLKGYTKAQLEGAFRSIPSSERALRLDFNGTTRPHVELLNEGTALYHRTTEVLAFLELLLTRFDLSEFRASLILCLSDAMPRDKYPNEIAPCLAFARRRNDHCTILWPDSEFMRSMAYAPDISEIDEFQAKCPWEVKIPRAFWRGSDSGWDEAEGGEVEKMPRVKLALMSKAMGEDGPLDARISRVFQCRTEENARRIFELDIVSGYLPFVEFLRYRYQIDIDGNTCAWKSFFLKLYSNSLVLKPYSDNLQWYYHLVQPWIHYIPVQRDLEDLPELIDWAKAHDAQCLEMAKSATELVEKKLGFDKVLEYTAFLLKNILSCQRDG